QWRSDLFVIDDLDEYARALEIIHDQERTGLAAHDHDARWALSPYEENPSGSYISINVWLDCGCTIRNLDVFAAQMRKQRGWDIAKSGGWGSGGGSYSMRARRKVNIHVPSARDWQSRVVWRGSAGGLRRVGDGRHPGVAGEGVADGGQDVGA